MKYLILLTMAYSLNAFAWDKSQYKPMSEKEIKAKLTKEQYNVARKDGTETPHKNEFWNDKRQGIYVDVLSGEPLFSSLDKFKSGTGWPSFTKPLVKKHIVYKEDNKFFRSRTEVRSLYAKSHLGHVFNDGPKPTGKRYCINSASLRFIAAKDLKKLGYAEYEQLFSKKVQSQSNIRKSYFAGGCFWCMEPPFEKMKGVLKVVSGYSGGDKKAPTYKQVSSGKTKHIEAIEITYDSSLVSYDQLLNVFWQQVDPTQSNGQFVDKGPQYRSAIFYQNKNELDATNKSLEKLKQLAFFKNRKIVTEILPYKNFFQAEDYHQDYYKKNPVRYKFYRFGSRRDSRLKEIWGEKRKLSSGKN